MKVAFVRRVQISYISICLVSSFELLPFGCVLILTVKNTLLALLKTMTGCLEYETRMVLQVTILMALIHDRTRLISVICNPASLVVFMIIKTGPHYSYTKMTALIFQITTILEYS